MNLHVISPGPLTTVQDAGRTGYAARGFRTCGAADGYAMRTANLLAGNPQAAGAAVLEMTLQGGKYQFDGDAVFALAGADMPAALDGRPVPAYTPLLARAGQVLAIGAARSGLRGYLAVFGGVDTPPVLGSRSTDLKCRMGGLGGRALKAGDVLPIGAAPAMVEQRWQQICAKGANRPLGTARTPARPWRFLGGRKLPLFRAVPGPQTDAFTAVGQAAFVHGVYALTADCDRMACKLQGPQIETVDGSDIVSDGIVAGSVQVSANGQPIVMLADHQTTGGYAKIATVISADLSAMAQLRPGEKLAFQYVTAAQAVAGARAQAAVLDKIRGADEIMDFAAMKPADLRGLIRKGELTGPTTGMCNGYAQGNLVVLPKALAWDFFAVLPAQPQSLPAAGSGGRRRANLCPIWQRQRYCYRYPALPGVRTRRADWGIHRCEQIL